MLYNAAILYEKLNFAGKWIGWEVHAVSLERGC